MISRLCLWLLLFLYKIYPFSKGLGRIQLLGLKFLQGQDLIVDCYGDTKFYLSFPRDNGWECLYFQGLCERNTTEIFSKLLKKESVFFDIGANIGWFSVLASKKIMSEGGIHAFEPAPNIHEELIKNLSLNNKNGDKIFINNMALGGEAGTVVIHSFPEKAHGHSSIKDVYGTGSIEGEVEMITLDQYIADNGIDNVDLIKLDVEGAEMMVLDGASNLLNGKNTPTWFIEMNEETAKAFNYECFELIERILNTGDYALYKVAGAWSTVTEMQDSTDFDHGDNVFCIPKSKTDEIKVLNSFIV